MLKIWLLTQIYAKRYDNIDKFDKSYHQSWNVLPHPKESLFLLEYGKI